MGCKPLESGPKVHTTRSSVWPLLRSFSWPELRLHAARHTVAVLAVMLGVALAFSVQLINASALSEFSAAVRSVSGQADLELRAVQGGLDEAMYPLVAQHPQVATASPVIDIETQALDAQGTRRALRIVGLDALRAAPVAPAMLPQLADGTDRWALFAVDAIALNAVAMRILGVQAGEVLTVQSGLVWRRLRVVGTVAASGAALGVMDIGAAQARFGELGRISRIDVKLRAGAQAADVLASLNLPSGVLGVTPDEATQRVSNVSRAYRVNLTVLALVALFTGAFLVFSILSLSVAKRQQQFALLGVLGLSARERLQLVLCESAVLGLIGSVLGIAAGTGLAQAALALLGGDLGGGYFPGVSPRLQWSSASAWLYGSLGVLAAVGGGWLPARAAARLAPAQALKGLGSSGSAAPLGQWLGPSMLGLGLLFAWLPPVAGVPLWAYLSVACILIGGIACVPLLVAGVLAGLPDTQHPLLLLASQRALRMRQTATVAIAGVVASLSLAVALTVMVSSFRDAVTRWLDVVLPADLYVRTGNSSGSSAWPISAALQQAIEQQRGVARVTGVRTSTLALTPGRAAVTLISRPLEAPEPSLPLVGAVLPQRANAVNVFVSEAMVDLFDARLGSTLVLPLVTGQPPVSTYVRGVWRDYARQQGTIVIDAADFQRLTGDTSVNDLALWLTPASRVADVQARVRQTADQLGLDGRLLEFAEPGAIRQTSLQIFDRSFAVTYWLQAVAIMIGLFGIAASFSAQVLARRKEFGLLSHLGLTRRQILTVVAGEGAALSVIGAGLGLVLGLAVSMILVWVVNPQSFHWTMELLVPWGRLGLLCAGVVLAATATAVVAGRAAAGHDAVLAVKEDW